MKKSEELIGEMASWRRRVEIRPSLTVGTQSENVVEPLKISYKAYVLKYCS